MPFRRHFLCLVPTLLGSLALPTFADAVEVPRTLDELWAGFAKLDQTTPLATEVLKEWESDGVVCRVVRFRVGMFKGAPSHVAAFYGFPKDGTDLPALLDLHGGGQSASLDNVLTYARRGYACLSLNWGGNKLNFGRTPMTYEGPQTDWGKLDATHPPQRNKVNHFAGPLTPDEFTLDAAESPRNSNWFVVLMAARRALTFLEQQPEVDGARLGVFGHSMGGKLTTNLAGIDPRVKAAVPSCGGAGDIRESQADLPGCIKTRRSELEMACISDNAYLPRIKQPILWLSPTNDFNAPIGNMAFNWAQLPDERVRFSISPHLNHRHTEAHGVAQYLWFEEHLKGAFKMPRTPEVTAILQNPEGVPQLVVRPDPSRPVRRVDVYYSIDPHELTRFWRDAKAVKVGEEWKASCPVMSPEQPWFAFANVTYDLPEAYAKAAQPTSEGDTPGFALSSRVQAVAPTQLTAAGIKVTDEVDRMIDDGARGWHDWYRLNWDHPPFWTATTRKLKDPKWRGPDGARLVLEVRSEADNALAFTVNCNAWGAFVPGQRPVDYSVVKELKGSPDWQTVSVSLEELRADGPGGGPLTNWRTVTELTLGPSREIVKDGRKIRDPGRAWKGAREIRNLRWEGGNYVPSGTAEAVLTPGEHQRAFNEAIQKSLEQEKAVRGGPPAL
jgi:hypothetical protein